MGYVKGRRLILQEILVLTLGLETEQGISYLVIHFSAMDDAELELLQLQLPVCHFDSGFDRYKNPSERYVICPDRDTGGSQVGAQKRYVP